MLHLIPKRLCCLIKDPNCPAIERAAVALLLWLVPPGGGGAQHYEDHFQNTLGGACQDLALVHVTVFRLEGGEGEWAGVDDSAQTNYFALCDVEGKRNKDKGAAGGASFVRLLVETRA